LAEFVDRNHAGSCGLLQASRRIRSRRAAGSNLKSVSANAGSGLPALSFVTPVAVHAGSRALSDVGRGWCRICVPTRTLAIRLSRRYLFQYRLSG
ncbi:MAG TPA: hypothetical protein VMX97_06810, partial [Hyphomicrobiaceae bacterium]|nr:hypothetical protein [Hyphomicrobiaceae bacterium]